MGEEFRIGSGGRRWGILVIVLRDIVIVVVGFYFSNFFVRLFN